MRCDECGAEIDLEDAGREDAGLEDAGLEDAGSEETAVCQSCGYEQPLHRRAPWGFKLFLVATVVYLGYRGYQGVAWLAHHL